MKKSTFLTRSLLLSLLFFPLAGNAQIFIEKGVRPHYSTRVNRVKSFPEMENFGDVFNSRKMWLGRDIFSGNVGYTFGRIVLKQDEPRHTEWRSALAFYTRIRIAEEFSINTTFYHDFNKNAVAPWTSDYTYSFGRFNWRSKTFSYGYKNYENNKYSDDFATFQKKFQLGNVFVSYIHDLPENLLSKIRLDYTTNVKFDLSGNYALKYRDAQNNIVGDGLGGGKAWFTLAARYTIICNIYAESAVYFYATPNNKQPWDPDYVYGFGYFDYKAFRAGLTYGNWVINRFPWNKRQYQEYGFWDGEFKLFVNYSW